MRDRGLDMLRSIVVEKHQAWQLLRVRVCADNTVLLLIRGRVLPAPPVIMCGDTKSFVCSDTRSH